MKAIEALPIHKKEDELLSAVLGFCKAHGAAMAAWKLPDSHEFHLIIDWNGADIIHEMTIEDLRSGFLFAPFEKSGKKLHIRHDLHIDLKTGTVSGKNEHAELIINYVNNFQPNTAERTLSSSVDVPENQSEGFINLVEAAITGVKKDAFKKVVPSRFKSIPLPGDFDPGKLFLSLFDNYPNAFISLVYDEICGLWMGATPELLLEVKDNTFKTVSLAGTQRFNGQPLSEVAWTQKEIEEQALVNRYIIDCFKKIRLREFEENGPKTVRAGNLIHLKSEFKVDMLATNFPDLGSVMLELLHPTSAICGMPLKPALNFLKDHEGYDREYFSGYLGPVNMSDSTSLFVNLRCMKVNAGTANLYAGAGVTADSIPLKEWQETEMKMNTLLTLIK